jgi:hypothetical protein
MSLLLSGSTVLKQRAVPTVLAGLTSALALVTGTCAAAQPRAKVAAATQSTQVFGYTDQDGVTCLTNLAPDPRTNPGYRVIVEAESAQTTPHSTIPPSPELHQWVEEAARREHVDGALIYAVMAVESGFNTKAVSNKGAAGLMQLMPSTALLYGVSNRFDGQSSVFAGARYLHDLLDVFGNNVTLAVAAYNAGENAVHMYHDQVPPFAETQNYVPRVLAVYHQLGGASVAR